MTLKFVPPKADSIPRYASFVKGSMKTHTGLGAAKQSLANRAMYWGDEVEEGKWCSLQKLYSESFILELVDGEWYTLYHIPHGTKHEDLPWMKDAWVDGHWGSRTFTEPYYRKDKYEKKRVAVPMTKEEYAEWRIKVELEKRGIEE